MLDFIKKSFSILICIHIILLFSGCNNEPQKNEQTTYQKKSPKADFFIAGCRIFYKGQELSPFTGTKVNQAPTIQSWIELLGNNFVNFDANIYVWKELGVRVYTRREDKDKVQTLTIIKHVPEPKYIELENYLEDNEHMEYFNSKNNNYETELRERIAEAKKKITIHSRIPHPKPTWFNGILIDKHFKKEAFNEKLAQYKQKLDKGYQSPLGQGSGSQFYEGYSVWRQSSFSKCDGGWGFETLIRIEQEFAPDNIISAINIGPDR